MNRYTISGLDHIIRLLQQHPQLIGLSSLAPIRQVAKQAQLAVAKSGCGCSATDVYNANRNTFERALDMMAHGDHIIVKHVLKVDQLCYYVKDKTGHNKIKCV